MLTETQRKIFVTQLKNYKKKYLVDKYFELDESATRLMINSFLSNVLGYAELDEVKTEYTIKGTYADYVIQLDKKQHIVIEVKAIQINLSENHIRQALGYAANEGIDWVLLTNGKQWMLFRVLFEKPIKNILVFNFDLSIEESYKKAIVALEYLTKKCVEKGDLEQYWERYIVIEPKNLCKYLYEPETIKLLKRMLKKEVGINFSEEDLFEAIHKIVITKIDKEKPKFKM